MHIQNFRQQNVDLVNFWLHFVMQTRTLGKSIINGNSKRLKIINKMCSVGENFYLFSSDEDEKKYKNKNKVVDELKFWMNCQA